MMKKRMDVSIETVPTQIRERDRIRGLNEKALTTINKSSSKIASILKME